MRHPAGETVLVMTSWAVRLAERSGLRKAAGATARKIAVLMLTLLSSWTDYQ